ncbi:GAF domain-containing protein, partial [Oceanospirillum sp. HFRX-1_2]
MTKEPKGFPAEASGIDNRSRLKELAELEIIGTDPEDQYDQIITLMTLSFNTPIAAISFIDENRQWFKSETGINQLEIPLTESFCSRETLLSEIVVIEDARTDHTLQHHPMVKNEPYIRFYAGVAIRGPNGQAVGTCYIMDRKPRKFSDNDIRQLMVFAQLVETQIRNHAEVISVKHQAVNSVYYDPLTGL